MNAFRRDRGAALFAGIGGAFAAIGVALSALAAHTPGGAGVSSAASILLAHAPLALGLAALRLAGLTALLVSAAGADALLGAALFAADVSARAFLGAGLFPYAAPIGGVLMIAGWTLFAALAPLALLRGRRTE